MSSYYCLIDPSLLSHYLLMRDIIIRSVQVNITDEQVDELEVMVNRWVTEYER
jgi:hypothetical protein